MTILWCMVPEMWRTTELFVILGHFLPFYSPKNPNNQNFAKIKKTVGDIIILHMSMINESHMRSVPWHVTDRIFCNFGLFFAFKKKNKIHSMQGWTATTMHRVTRKRSTKRKQHTGNLIRKNLQLKDVY